MGKTEWTMTAIFTAIGAIFTIIAISVESVVAKWIWGILAAAVFIFTIYAIIDAIVKSRRKPKDCFFSIWSKNPKSLASKKISPRRWKQVQIEEIFSLKVKDRMRKTSDIACQILL